MSEPTKPRWPVTFPFAPQLTFVVMSLAVATIAVAFWSAP